MATPNDKSIGVTQNDLKYILDVNQKTIEIQNSVAQNQKDIIEKLNDIDSESEQLVIVSTQIASDVTNTKNSIDKIILDQNNSKVITANHYSSIDRIEIKTNNIEKSLSHISKLELIEKNVANSEKVEKKIDEIEKNITKLTWYITSGLVGTILTIVWSVVQYFLFQGKK